jgi:trk system potassium uptake protein TrkA
MVTCQVAHSVFNIPRKIARLRAQSYLTAIYSDLYRRDHLPIDVVISPEREVASAALQRLSAPDAFDTDTFFDGYARLLGIVADEDCPVLNTPLRQLTDLFSTLRATVVGIRREGTLYAPEAGDQIFEGDHIYLFIYNEDLNRTLEIFGKTPRKQERVVLVGGGNVGLAVAKELESAKKRIRMKVIEKDRKRAEKAADALERTIVLNGDGLDAALLEEAQIGRADAVLCVTDDDKTNMLAATRAKSLGCPMSIALINDPTLLPMIDALGIDAYINPRATTVSSILRHIRHGRVRNVYSIGDAEAEVIEAQVLSTSPLSGKPVRDIAFPEGVLLGGIMRGEKYLNPRGNTVVEEGDIVSIFSLTKDVPEVERLLQVSIDYF